MNSSKEQACATEAKEGVQKKAAYLNEQVGGFRFTPDG